MKSGHIPKDPGQNGSSYTPKCPKFIKKLANEDLMLISATAALLKMLKFDKSPIFRKFGLWPVILIARSNMGPGSKAIGMVNCEISSRVIR